MEAPTVKDPAPAQSSFAGTNTPAADSVEARTPTQVSDITEALTVPIPLRDIRDADYPRLKAVMSQLKAGLDTSARSLAQIRLTAQRKQSKPTEDRSHFDFAYSQVRACELALRASIEAASLATEETAAELQAKVAENYEAYSRAVTVARATAKSHLADNSASQR
jgi:hypothetical protein